MIHKSYFKLDKGEGKGGRCTNRLQGDEEVEGGGLSDFFEELVSQTVRKLSVFEKQESSQNDEMFVYVKIDDKMAEQVLTNQ